MTDTSCLLAIDAIFKKHRISEKEAEDKAESAR